MATLDTAHNYSPTWLGLATQLGIAGSISLYCLLQFEWNRRKKSMAYLYTPRTRLSKNSSPPIPPGLFSWVKATIFLPEHFYLQNVGLDAVMYLRFLKIAFRFLLFNLLIVGSILMPINYFGKGTETGVQVFSVNNLAENNDSFLWAHMFCTYVVSISWMYLLYINYRDYVEMRKEYFVNKAKAGSVSARSVIVSRIPEDLRSEEKLKAYFETLGVGRVESVRLVRHTGKLDRKINRRENALLALERAHIQLAKNVCHGLLKRHWFFGNVGRWFNGQANVPSTALEDGSTRENQRLQSLIEWMERRRKKGGDEEESFTSPVNKNSAIHTTSTFSTGEEFLDQEDGYGRQFLIWEALAQIPKITIDRFQPTHRKGYFGTGTRVRSIDHYLKKFNYLDRRIAELRALPVNDKPYKPTSTGFVTFYSHSSAHLAAQSIMCSKPHTCTTRMAPEPRDLLWENLAMAFREKVIRYLLVNVSVWALTIFWLFPIFAFLTLTSFDSLSQRIRFLSVFLESAPIVRTLLQNVLPTVLVTFFMSLLPWILMEISKQESFSAYSELEESVLKRYYYFSFFNVFIVFLLGITFLESIFDVLNQPTSIIETLAQSLPQGATFFINYIVFNICSHGLELIQVGSQLFLHIILTSRFVTTTPRMLERVTSPWAFQFYYYYPNHILVLVITITYSTINPLILIFALIYYAMALVVFKHQFAYAYVRRYESGGKFYRNVFRYTTDGLIIFQLTMIGLLWLRRTLVPGALLVPLIFGTGYFKYYCHKTFYSRTHYLAMDTRIEVNPSSSVGQTPNSSTQRESHQLDGEGLNEKGSTVAVSPATSQTEHPDKTEKSQNGKENMECKPSSSVEIGFGSVFNRRSVGEGFQRLKVDENADNISDTIATNEQSIGADNANASEPDPSPEARRVGPRVRLSLEQGTVRPGRSSTELQRLSAPPTPKTPNVETVDENTSNLDTKVGLTLDMEFLKRNNKSAVSTLVTGEFSKASDSVNSEATPGTGSASSNGTTPVTTPNPNCKDSRDTRPPQMTIEAKELTIASPISGAGVSLSPNVTNNNRLSIPSPPSRQASGFLSRHNIHLAHDPNGKLLQDDTSPYQTYFHPNLVKALNRKLWLPRNPLKKISVEDTVELERALTSSEGGYGLVGYWGGASGFLGEARISMYDTNQGLVFPMHERGVSGLSGISVVSEIFGHGDENSRIYLQRRGTTENTNGTNTPGEPVVNDNGQLFSPLSPLSLEGEEGLVHVDDFVSGELESGELTSGESS